MRFRILLLFLFGFSFSILSKNFTTKNSIDFDNLTVESFSFERGISHQTVYDMYKDSEGFLWFGTMYGLVHYMGSEIIVYRHDPNDTTTLSNDDVTKIFEDSKGRFWIATFGGGFNLLDLKSDRIKRFTPTILNLADRWNGIVWDITEDKDGNILIATDNYGILKLNPQGGLLQHFQINKDKSITTEKKFMVVSENEIYLRNGTEGFYKFDYGKNKFVDYIFPDLGNESIIRDIVKDENRKLWICTLDNVFKYDPQRKKAENISDKYPLIKNARYIRKIFIDKSGNIWLGGYGELFVIDKESGKVYNINNSVKNSIHNGPVIGILQDSNGIIWTGTYRGGINKIYSDTPIFTSIKYVTNTKNTLAGDKVTDVIQINDNKAAITTNNGLSIWDKSKKQITNYFEGEIIYSIVKGPRENLWFGSREGVFEIDKNYRVIRKFIHDENNSESINAGTVVTILFDRDGYLWVGTVTGLSKINLSTNEIVNFKNDPENSAGFHGSTVLSLYEDSEGFIYAGTYFGLNRYNKKNNRFTLFKHDPRDPKTISNNYVFAYLEDSRGNFWIATGGGLNKYDRAANTFSALTQNDGLSNSVTYGLVELNNNLFISTAEGISVLNLNNKKINTFFKSHGLQGNMFSARAYSIDESNNIYFGGNNGITIINTHQYFNSKFNPPVVITGVSSINKNFIDNLPYKSIKEITIPYNSNYVRFNFTSLDFKNPDNLNYKYRLVGFDSTWMNSEGKPFTQYPEISPGEYNFEVKVVNSSGFEGNNIASIKLVVTPPFWQTVWFYFSIAFVLVVIFYSAHRYKVNSEVKRLIEIEKIREEEETKLRKKAADDFHDELGHRITKISLYSELLKRTISDQESGSSVYLQKISDISSNLATGVKDFIWTLDPGKDSLYEVAIRLKDFGDDLFDKSGISFRTSGIDESFEKIIVPMDWRRHIILIFKEAMNNILKYSNAKNVLLSFSINSGEIDIALNDDGTGFDIEKIKSGRGLKNIRMRAASVNGKVDIESSKEKGTSITLHSSLP